MRNKQDKDFGQQLKERFVSVKNYLIPFGVIGQKPKLPTYFRYVAFTMSQSCHVSRTSRACPTEKKSTYVVKLFPLNYNVNMYDDLSISS